jgi:hypothetical protein
LESVRCAGFGCAQGLFAALGPLVVVAFVGWVEGSGGVERGVPGVDEVVPGPASWEA